MVVKAASVDEVVTADVEDDSEATAGPLADACSIWVNGGETDGPCVASGAIAGVGSIWLSDPLAAFATTGGTETGSVITTEA